jgi:hypothetical protein
MKLKSATALLSFWLAVVALLPVMALSGCYRVQATHDDHLEHHVPEHKPHDLHAAIDQIEDRFEALAHGDVPKTDRMARLKELVDIVRWLPEIAGDSDLPEEPWNTVDQVSQQLAGLLQKAAAGAQAGEPPALAPLHSTVDAALDKLRTAAELPIEPEPIASQHDHHNHGDENHD